MSEEDTREGTEVGAILRTARPANAPKRTGNRKISRKLVALGATSILAVWSIGFAGSNVAANQANVSVSSIAASSTTAAIPTATATGLTASATTGQYKDGTYSGTGSSRHGSIQVQVVVQGGKITSAAITGSSTRYSPSVISSLPGAVVAQQSSNVNLVSGATDSSTAFIGAVSNALAQAA